MVENKLNIDIADKLIQSGELWSKNTSRIKASNLAGMFVSAYLLGKKYGPRENPPLTHFGVIERVRNVSNIFNSSLSGPI